MNETFVLTTSALAALAVAAPYARARLQLSLAKHPSLTGHARMARRVAAWVPGYAYDEAGFFGSDGAPDDVQQRRRVALQRLRDDFGHRFARSLQATDAVRPAIPDLQFTGAYRVPFQYSRYLREQLRVPAFVCEAAGVTITDLDGNTFYDLTGSYGVNLFGVDFYKKCIDDGAARVRALGPVLGSYHPCVAYNVQQMRRISGMDEVSFHMSGTEAVMQAVRLARYHTGRRRLVRFAGAYHGWWDDVQPGPGNPLPARETYTLREMDERTLDVLRSRRDIACVLVNPLQALHPNSAAPGDSTLLDGSRQAHFDRTAYTRWLRELRSVCSERGIALIFDEVFVGFRLAPGGAQEYFGVSADLVAYGKTVAGGLPIGVVCGRSRWMRRFRDDRPADICFARGTFNSHPYVMGAMQAFLERFDGEPVQALYRGLDETWNARATLFNHRMATEGLPLRASNLSTIWTIGYDVPSRYNWMLQFYLRAHGLALSWVGTGRLIFSLNYAQADFDDVVERFVAAAREMQADGWWWHHPQQTNRSIRRGVLREMLAHRMQTSG
ncbi:MAG TPA: aminotransferase class III-fold pyridoxal phosphate-dependent enzyme [Burkholderiaceae bacterium]|nr:aminotransferase class III-fold pyridoxal phosphate-dependent enzyme [Burkholderiaceae bacterium]